MDKTKKIDHLKELNHSDYKIAEDQPHIDDWKIVDRSDRKVGKVHDMLFDKDRMKVRYIITNLKDGEVMNEDRKVLIPIGQAQLDTSMKRVIVPKISKEHLIRLPRYERSGDLTPEDETLILDTFTGTTTTTPYNKETFYKNENFDEDRFYDHEKMNNMDQKTTNKKVDVVEEKMDVGKKEIETGRTKVTSRIVERPVKERVNLREEHVEVKRKPVDKPASSADMKNFKEKTLEETETAEVPVVNKEARIKEEISLEKKVENKKEVIKDKLKETKVDIDKKSDKMKNKDAFASRNKSKTEKSENRF